MFHASKYDNIFYKYKTDYHYFKWKMSFQAWKSPPLKFSYHKPTKHFFFCHANLTIKHFLLKVSHPEKDVHIVRQA